jgi:hypothetical protein
MLNPSMPAGLGRWRAYAEELAPLFAELSGADDAYGSSTTIFTEA